jgi:malonyl-CoA/methylmalonyl-CoA synthetase
MTAPSSHHLWERLRAGFPAALDTPAITTCDGPGAPLVYSWRDLERGSAMIAGVLAGLDLPAGSRVAVQVGKSVEAVMLYLAVLRAGHVFLPLNTAYREAEIGYFVGNAEPAVVVCAPEDFPWVSRIAFAAGTKNVFTLGEAREGTLLERAVFQPDTFATVPRAADDLAAILYTSGTTGRSKGAMLTHANLVANAAVLHRFWGFEAASKAAGGPGDVLVHALPIFHVHGLFVALHAALVSGTPMLWFARFDAAAVLRRLPAATVFMGVPTLYVRLLAEPGLTREAVRGMRLFVSGSAPLLAETFHAFRERTGHVILERYGMSETLMLTSNPYAPEDGERRAGTVGRALPGTSVRIHDNKGRPLPAGEVGGVEVKGPSVFKGYWRMPEKTADDFTTDLWFKTGDVGRLDERGVLTLVGRSKDLVITGGYNVYPAEVEGAIDELPGVAESAVIGVPHADFGEAVVALVVPRPGAAADPAAMQAAVQGALKARVAGFKVPKRVLVVPELPRNAMGKVQKNLLREQHRTLFQA